MLAGIIPMLTRRPWLLILSLALVILLASGVALGAVSANDVLSVGFVVLFFISHLLMHGGHGTHTSHTGHDEGTRTDPRRAEKQRGTANSEDTAHGCH